MSGAGDQTWITVMAAVLSGTGVQMANFLAQRAKKEAKLNAYAQGAVDRAMKSVSEQLGRTDARLEHVEAQHENCERRLEEEQRARRELQANIEKLMAERVAGPWDKPPTS